LSIFRADASLTGEDREESALGLSRTAVFIWAAAILFLNQIFGVLRAAPTAWHAEAATDVAAVGIFQYMAWYAVFRLLAASDRSLVARLTRLLPGRFASRTTGSMGGWYDSANGRIRSVGFAARAARPQDVVVCTLLSLLVFVPTSRSVWVAATGFAAYLWWFNTGDKELRSAGVVLAALSIQQFWGHWFFELFSYPLLRAETTVVGAILEATRTGTVWRDNVIVEPNGHAIVILAACSSFHNLSIALLYWVTVCRLRNQNWRSRDLIGGMIVAGTMVFLNGARLYLMALGSGRYHYWHDGTGAQIFAVGVSLTVLLLCLFGARPAESRA
jgi:Transmembrane exosortase (Exosortase_EpsH)